jgi:hypothetical protein
MRWTQRMTLQIRSKWLYFKYDLSNLPGKIKRIVWNKWIMVRWNRLWIRKDEMHKSLDGDLGAMLEMGPEELQVYRDDLVQRRHIAHENDPDIAEWNAELLAGYERRQASRGR